MRMPNTGILLSNHANQFKTLREIDIIAREESKHPFVISSVDKFGLRNDLESIKKVLEAAFNVSTFQADPVGDQYIRTLNRSLKDRIGNCVDYTVFISSFLRRMQVPHIIRMAAFEPKYPNSYQHIYPVTMTGLVLDAVSGQDQSGDEYLKDASKRKAQFNVEVPYIKKFDKIIAA